MPAHVCMEGPGTTPRVLRLLRQGAKPSQTHSFACPLFRLLHLILTDLAERPCVCIWCRIPGSPSAPSPFPLLITQREIQIGPADLHRDKTPSSLRPWHPHPEGFLSRVRGRVNGTLWNQTGLETRPLPWIWECCLTSKT